MAMCYIYGFFRLDVLNDFMMIDLVVLKYVKRQIVYRRFFVVKDDKFDDTSRPLRGLQACIQPTIFLTVNNY